MSAETKTETLADVLKDLTELAPERFDYYECDEPLFDIGIRGSDGRERSYVFDCDDTHHVSLAILQAACQEECEARGWYWEIAYDPKEHGFPLQYIASIQDAGKNYSLIADGQATDSAAPAIATALRDALKADE